MRASRSMAVGVVSVAALLLTAACGSSSPSSAKSGGSGGSSSSTTATHLVLDANGNPVMKGASFTMGNAAGDATIGDTVAYLVPQILKQWGASTNFQLGNGNNTELAVVSGQLISTAGPLDTCLDAGLSLFGPNQVHVDYLLVSNKVASVSALKGKTIALATAVSPDQNLLTLALQQAKLSRSDIHTFLSGSNGASESAMIKGAVDAAWVHADALIKLQKHGSYNVLTKAGDVAPYLADSYMCAKPDWISAHPAYAEAIDLAWIKAANTFNNNESGWVQAAQAYTKGADPVSTDQQDYAAIAKAQPWNLANQAHFTTSDVQQNFAQAQSSGRIKGQGSRPESQYLVLGPWQAAWAVYQAHKSTYGG